MIISGKRYWKRLLCDFVGLANPRVTRRYCNFTADSNVWLNFVSEFLDLALHKFLQVVKIPTQFTMVCQDVDLLSSLSIKILIIWTASNELWDPTHWHPKIICWTNYTIKGVFRSFRWWITHFCYSSDESLVFVKSIHTLLILFFRFYIFQYILSKLRKKLTL